MKNGIVLATMGLAGGALASLAGQYFGTARATVPPAGQRLFYSGEVSGLAPGSHVVQVEFFSASTGGSSLCGTNEAVVGAGGSVRVNVSNCDAALQSTSDVFVQLVVDPATATPLAIPPAGTARPRVGAVPYSVQAAASVTADAVPFAGVTGTNVPWPGTIAAGSITGSLSISSVSIPSSTVWPGTVPHASITGGPRFCGVTATSSASAGGYATVAPLCASACGGVGHLCTGHELVLSIQAGVSPPSSPVGASYWFAGSTSDAGKNTRDCTSFTSAASTEGGTVWRVESSGQFAEVVTCNTGPRAFLCCR